jgi:hypothetical protein
LAYKKSEKRTGIKISTSLAEFAKEFTGYESSTRAVESVITMLSKGIIAKKANELPAGDSGYLLLDDQVRQQLCDLFGSNTGNWRRIAFHLIHEQIEMKLLEKQNKGFPFPGRSENGIANVREGLE